MESCHSVVRVLEIPHRLHLSRQFSFTFSLVGREVHSRRSFILLRVLQHWSAYRDVLLLHACRDGTTIPKVLVVEEVLDSFPNGSVHCRHAPRFPTARLESLQLPICICLVDWTTCRHVLLLVQEFLRSSLQKGSFLPVEEEKREFKFSLSIFRRKHAKSKD
jgi:hypothetical protein